jgi:Sap, sulfolipid-1-addressing protein
MLLLPSPAKLMAGYLVGALMTSITLGLVIVFSLSDSSAANTTKSTLNPAVDIALGGLALLVSWVVWSGRSARAAESRRARKEAKPDKGPPRWQRELSKGSPRTTFVIGALLTLPGASYLAGLSHIHKLHYSTTVTVLVVLGFNLVMLWLLEVPLMLSGRAGLDAPCDRSSQGLGQPARPRLRCARIRDARRATDCQGHHRADQLTAPMPISTQPHHGRPRLLDLGVGGLVWSPER